MKGDFDGLIEFEKLLLKLEQGLEGGEEFLVSRAPAYRGVAEATAKAVLGAMRPPDTDALEWNSLVQEFAEFLAWKAVGGGFEIFYRKYEEKTESGERADISFRDVLEWVKSGAEAGGKDKSESEISAGKTDEEIAHVVTKAINQYQFGFASVKDYGPITRRLEEFVKTRFLSADLSEVLSEVLSAWVEVIGPMIEEDFEKWVDGLIAKL